MTTLLARLIKAWRLVAQRYCWTFQSGSEVSRAPSAIARPLSGSAVSKQNLARADLSEANENFLAGIGADIHDGPIQLLSLLILRLTVANRDSEEYRELAKITRQAITELRAISSGLVLPEISSLSLEETIRLAVLRHEGLTGEQVEVQIRSLPPIETRGVKICVYRVVQEALNNAHKHAPGSRQSVSCYVTRSLIHLTISDTGAGLFAKPALTSQTLGIAGMQSRAEALGGRVYVVSEASGGTRVKLSLPILKVDRNQFADDDTKTSTSPRS